MAKRILIVVIALLVLFGLVFGFHVMRSLLVSRYVHQLLGQPVTISTAKAQAQQWNPYLRAVGSFAAVNGVDVNSQVAGQVVKISFQSGQDAKQGDLLVQLDDSLDQQNLKSQQAQLTFAQGDYNRKKTLAQEKVIAQTDLDQAYKTLVQAQAAVAQAQLNIAFKHIRAPFSGRLGISQVNLGQYISPGQALVSIQQMDPLYVDFSLPEQQLQYLYQDQPVELTVEAFPNRKFTGKVTALNAKSDPNTHTISVRATVPNPKTELFPGIFAEVNVILPAVKSVVTIPQTAIAYSLHGDSVFVVVNKGKDEKGKPILVAEQRFVTLGEQQGNVVAILSGLQAGEQVVNSGQIKLQPGARVNVDNSVKL